MRRLISGVFGFVLVLGGVFPAAAVLPSPVIGPLRSSAFILNEELGACGGTFVTTDIVLTAYHCIEDSKTTLVYDASGVEYRMIGGAIDESRDLALVKLDRASAIARPAPRADAGIGEEVWVVGAPAGEPFLVIHGYVAAIKNLQVEDGKPYTDPCTHKTTVTKIGTATQQYLYLDARTYFGDSGGGVFDTQGNLLGVVTRMQAVGTCDVRYPLWGLAVGPDAIDRFLTGK